jgi:hypothetical protein
VGKGLKFSDLKPGVRLGLAEAIDIANNTGGSNTIMLAPKVYKLDKVLNYWYGPNALPPISSDITISGYRATIERSGGPDFRFFYVSNSKYGGLPTGSLTLKNLTLEGGVAKGGDGGQGGGGLGAGGAIFNQGTLVLNHVAMKDNTAEGGSFRYQAVGGGGIGRGASSFALGGGFGGPLPGAAADFATTGGPAREGQGGGSLTGNAGGLGGGGGGGGGKGGFGGGGGTRGLAGFGGGDGGGGAYGGGGAALGGAIFNRGGVLTVVNSSLTNNWAHGGDGHSNVLFRGENSGAGSAFGGAIFNLNGSVRLIDDTIKNNRLDGGAGLGGRTDGYQVYNLVYGGALYTEGDPVVARIDLAGTTLTGAPRDRHDLVNQTFLNYPFNLQAVVANPSDNNAVNVISTAPANLNAAFANGSSGTSGWGVVSVRYVESLTTGALEAVAAEVERTAINLGRTHNPSLASARLRELASQVPDGLAQLAPVWQNDLATYNPHSPGSGQAFGRRLLADLKQDVAAAVGAGEVRLTGPGASAYLGSAVLPQASADSVTIFNSTGFTISVGAFLNSPSRNIPARTIANGTSSLFEFGSNGNGYISINVSRYGSSQPPQASLNLGRPVSGYNGKQFAVSLVAGRFSVSF